MFSISWCIIAILVFFTALLLQLLSGIIPIPGNSHETQSNNKFSFEKTEIFNVEREIVYYVKDNDKNSKFDVI